MSESLVAQFDSMSDIGMKAKTRVDINKYFERGLDSWSINF